MSTRKIKPSTLAPIPSPSNLYNPTDIGNAEMLAAKHNGEILFDHLRGKWFIWDKSRWKEDDNGLIYRIAKVIPRDRRNLADSVSGGLNEDNRIKHIKWSLISESANRVNAMLSLAEKEEVLADSGKQWDTHPMLVGCKNGVLDLETGKIIPPDPLLRITKQLGCKFDPKAKSPLWESTIASYWPQADGMDVVDYIQRAFGYCLTASIIEQCFFSLYGEGGNGKSTVLEVMRDTIGDYSYTMPFSTLEFQSRSSISNDVAALVGRRFIISSETQEGIRLNEGRIKSLTGDASITARFLHKEYFTFIPVGKFWLAFNHKPKICDDSKGLWRRVRLIAFDQEFEGAMRIKGLEEKLKGELSGILNWILRGCLEWQKRGLEPPSSVTKDTENYKVESNPLYAFLEDECVIDSEAKMPTSYLYGEYQEWSRRNGERFSLSKNSFGRKMSALGYKNGAARVHGGVERCWEGIRMRTRPKQSDDSIEVISEKPKIN